MPATEGFEGLGEAKTPVRMVPSADWSAAKLTAQEGFVLSRVDSNATLETLCLVSGLGKQVTCRILRRLAELGLICIGVPGTAPAPPRVAASPSTQAPRTATARGVPAVQLPQPPPKPAARPQARQRTPTPPFFQIPVIPVEGAAPSRAAPPREQPAPAPEAAPEPRPVVTEPAPEPRLTTPEDSPAARPVTPSASAAALEPLPDEPDVDLKPEVRRSIRALHSRLGGMNFFQLLDVDPGADSTTVRRAYFKRSKEFHPDRYFTKRVGPYKAMLDEIFKQISAAYHFLEDEAQRASYRDMVLQEAADRALLEQVEAQGAQAMEGAVTEDGDLPPLDTTGDEEPPPRPERRRSGFFKPKFPWGPRPPTQTQPTVPAEPPPEQQVSTEEQQAREQRRQEDRRRRIRKLSNPMLGRPRQARQFYEQGLRQLAAGQVLAASASLKLALTFGGEDPEFRKAYEEASQKSRTLTAENAYKRALFEESVGRMETAGKFFLEAADAFPKAVYLQKAAEAMLHSRDLIKARDYATRAVQNDPTSADARIVLAKVYEAAGMRKNARRELDEALRLEPGNPAAKELLKLMRWG